MPLTTNVPGGTKTRRTVEAYVHSPCDGDFRLTLYRQIVIKDEKGAEIASARDNNPVQKSEADIKDLSVKVDGLDYTGAEVMQVLEALFDAMDAPAPVQPQTPPASTPAAANAAPDKPKEKK